MATIWCIGRNYAAHAKELGNEVPDEPVIFLKAEACRRGLAPEPVAFPDEAFHHELELVLHIGAAAPLGSDPGWAAVRGVSLGLDLTRRQVQSTCKAKGVPWTRAKSFAGSAVVGPEVPLAEVGDPDALAFHLDVDGERRQVGRIADALFDVPSILRHLTQLAPLTPGDLVFTGTPHGVGPIRVGQRFELTLVGATTHRWSGQL
jgi:2-keto-4-pentenoate hydratase/2-oxohepta-3-ene-1,7-dioic acid hydratase in catechol pathway